MTAILLPSPKLQFFDENGAPLVGGHLYTKIPATDTAKTTWQDAAQSVANTNPIVLDERGECIVWGAGTYRFQLYSVDQNAIETLVWDGLSTDGSGVFMLRDGSNVSMTDEQKTTFRDYIGVLEADPSIISFATLSDAAAASFGARYVLLGGLYDEGDQGAGMCFVPGAQTTYVTAARYPANYFINADGAVFTGLLQDEIYDNFSFKTNGADIGAASTLQGWMQSCGPAFSPNALGEISGGFYQMGASAAAGAGNYLFQQLNRPIVMMESCFQFTAGATAASFTGSISGTVLTVTAVASGALSVGRSVIGAGVADGVSISSLGTGTGGAGTYNLNVAQTVASEALTARTIGGAFGMIGWATTIAVIGYPAQVIPSTCSHLIVRRDLWTLGFSNGIDNTITEIVGGAFDPVLPYGTDLDIRWVQDREGGVFTFYLPDGSVHRVANAVFTSPGFYPCWEPFVFYGSTDDRAKVRRTFATAIDRGYIANALADYNASISLTYFLQNKSATDVSLTLSGTPQIIPGLSGQYAVPPSGEAVFDVSVYLAQTVAGPVYLSVQSGASTIGGPTEVLNSVSEGQRNASILVTGTPGNSVGFDVMAFTSGGTTALKIHNSGAAAQIPTLSISPVS